MREVIKTASSVDQQGGCPIYPSVMDIVPARIGTFVECRNNRISLRQVRLIARGVDRRCHRRRGVFPPHRLFAVCRKTPIAVDVIRHPSMVGIQKRLCGLNSRRPLLSDKGQYRVDFVVRQFIGEGRHVGLIVRTSLIQHAVLHHVKEFCVAVSPSMTSSVQGRCRKPSGCVEMLPIRLSLKLCAMAARAFSIVNMCAAIDLGLFLMMARKCQHRTQSESHGNENCAGTENPTTKTRLNIWLSHS